MLREVSQTGNIKLREVATRLITVTTGQPPTHRAAAAGTADRVATASDACPIAVYGEFRRLGGQRPRLPSRPAVWSPRVIACP